MPSEEGNDQEKDFRFEALRKNTFLYQSHDPRVSVEACVVCDSGFIILVMRGDGGTVGKQTMNHLHCLSPLLGPPYWGALPSFEPGAHQWICDSSPELLHEDC